MQKTVGASSNSTGQKMNANAEGSVVFPKITLGEHDTDVDVNGGCGFADSAGIR